MITSLFKDGFDGMRDAAGRKSYADGITRSELTPVGDLLERDATRSPQRVTGRLIRGMRARARIA
jgi:hypothetical protein